MLHWRVYIVLVFMARGLPLVHFFGRGMAVHFFFQFISLATVDYCTSTHNDPTLYMYMYTIYSRIHDTVHSKISLPRNDGSKTCFFTLTLGPSTSTVCFIQGTRPTGTRYCVECRYCMLGFHSWRWQLAQ